MGDPAQVELEICGVLPAPLSEVLHAFEPFAGLRELEHSVVVVDLVGDVLVLAGVLPVTLQRVQEVRLNRASLASSGSNWLQVLSTTCGEVQSLSGWLSSERG